MTLFSAFFLQLYREDPRTGEIRLALSADSTCSAFNDGNDNSGRETLHLRPRPPRPWPAHLRRHLAAHRCDLPGWAQGKWEHVHVQGGSLVLRDQRDFKTYTARCAEAVSVGDSDDDEVEEGRYLVYARSQCGDEHYKCVWLKNRGNNAMEFQIGGSTYTS